MYDPATGKQVGTSADAGPHEVDLAIGAADAAFADWSGRTGLERGALLRKLSAELLDAVEAIADVIVAEQGKPRAQAAFEVRMATQWLDGSLQVGVGYDEYSGNSTAESGLRGFVRFSRGL